jgi:hypothetical protein
MSMLYLHWFMGAVSHRVPWYHMWLGLTENGILSQETNNFLNICNCLIILCQCITVNIMWLYKQSFFLLVASYMLFWVQ